MRFLMMRETKKTNQLMVNIITNYGDLPHEEEWIEGLKSILPGLTTIVHNQNGQKSNIATGEIEKVLHGPGFIEEDIMGKRFRISSNSFFQTNPVQAERLYQTGFDLLPLEIKNVLDLYCGTGTIGLSLADRVEHVTGVELVAEAVKAARENGELNGVTNVEFIEANATDYLRNLENEDDAYDLVILDPPRAGLHPKALKHIMRMSPPGILYISCNPATFARDVAQLVGRGYAIGEVQPVDMFPHTMHIEVVAYLSRLAPPETNN
jgi:23S rRNA (uracil1939-C5)-methyltransferase